MLFLDVQGTINLLNIKLINIIFNLNILLKI